MISEAKYRVQDAMLAEMTLDILGHQGIHMMGVQHYDSQRAEIFLRKHATLLHHPRARKKA